MSDRYHYVYYDWCTTMIPLNICIFYIGNLYVGYFYSQRLYSYNLYKKNYVGDDVGHIVFPIR
jgi:hypothetical protein